MVIFQISVFTSWHSTLRMSFVQDFFPLFNISLDLWIISKCFIYLYLAVLGLHHCTQAFSSCSEQGLLSLVEHRLSDAQATAGADTDLGDP